MMQVNGGSVMAYFNSGTVIGDNTNILRLDIGFEPDVVFVSSDVIYAQSGWTGIGHVIILKNQLSQMYRHRTSSDTNANAHFYQFAEGDEAYGSQQHAPQYGVYGTYADGIFTVKDVALVLPGVVFTDGRTYNWTAYKA